MTKDEILKLALEAGLLRSGDGWTEPHRWGQTEIERFAALVATAEREACIAICARIDSEMSELGMAHHCEAAIRARGNND